MNLKTVLGLLEETDFLEDLNPWWDEAMLAFPACRPAFLDPDGIKTSLEWCGFDVVIMSFAAKGN